MASIQPIATGSAPVKSKTDTGERSVPSGQLVEAPTAGGSKPLSPSTTPAAATAKSSKKTSKNLDLPALRLQASLLAGDVGIWKNLKGRVKSETVLIRQPDGEYYKAIRIILALDGTNLEVVDTPDGKDFVVEGKRMDVEEGSGEGE